VIGHCVSPQPWREIDAHGVGSASVGKRHCELSAMAANITHYTTSG